MPNDQQQQDMTTLMTVSPALAEAYRRTEFRVSDRGWTFVLRHEEYSKVLEACHAAFSVTCSAYITAWNPRSELTAPEVNRAAQVRLEAELAAAGYAFLPGVGMDPLGQWSGEPSVLVLGINMDDAVRLGRAYEQNAILVAGKDSVPRLMMLDGEPGGCI